MERGVDKNGSDDIMALKLKTYMEYTKQNEWLNLDSINLTLIYFSSSTVIDQPQI